MTVSTITNAIASLEQNLSDLAQPDDTNLANGKATNQPVLNGIGTVLHILYGLTDGSGIGVALNQVGDELCAILQKAVAVVHALADACTTATDAVTAIHAARQKFLGDLDSLSLLPDDPSGPLVSQLGDLLSTGNASKLFYEIAQELNAIASALKPGA